MRIGVNCGHTKSGAGCGAIGYLDESEEARKVGYRLMEYLRAAGHSVFDCTNDKASNTNANLKNIVALANAQDLDVFYSIHFNAGGGKGVEVYTYGGKKHNEAVNICERLERFGFANRGVKDGSRLYVIKNTKAKAALIEVCFVDTKSDAELYQKIGADAVAREIFAAIAGEQMKETTLKEDCDLLLSSGIINSPDYWANGSGYSDENTALLIKKFADYVRGNGG